MEGLCKGEEHGSAPSPKQEVEAGMSRDDAESSKVLVTRLAKQIWSPKHDFSLYSFVKPILNCFYEHEVSENADRLLSNSDLCFTSHIPDITHLLKLTHLCNTDTAISVESFFLLTVSLRAVVCGFWFFVWFLFIFHLFVEKQGALCCN